MLVYAILRKLLPKPIADAGIAVWYLILLFLIYCLAYVPAGEFRYMQL